MATVVYGNVTLWLQLSMVMSHYSLIMAVWAEVPTNLLHCEAYRLQILSRNIRYNVAWVQCQVLAGFSIQLCYSFLYICIWNELNKMYSLKWSLLLPVKAPTIK